MKCIVYSFTYSPERETYPNKVGILTDDEISPRIRLFGEVFTVEKIEPKGYKDVSLVCEEFPTAKSHLFEELPIDGSAEYELLEDTNE